MSTVQTAGGTAAATAEPGRGGRLLRLLPAVAWSVACWPLLRHGLTSGHDLGLELVRVAEYRAAWAAPACPPAWADNLYGGYGSPIFLFYAPLFLAAAAGLSRLTGSIFAGTSAALLALTALSALAIGGAARLLAAAAGPAAARAASRVAVYAFLLSPYLLSDKYLRNANAEFAALCLAPVVFAGLLMRRRGPRTLALSAGLALVILAHNLTALVVFALALGAAAVLDPPAAGGAGSAVRRLAATAGGLTLGLALAAFFWLPALALKPWMRTEDLLTGRFDFHTRFPTFRELAGYGTFFSAGPLVLLIPVAAAAVLLWRPPADRRLRRAGWGLVAAAILCLLMMVPASTPVWETVPFLPLFQFPWRWVGPLALVSSLLAAVVFARLASAARPALRQAAEALIFLLCAANALPALTAVQPLPAAQRAELQTMLAPERLRLGAPATVGDEYLPRPATADLWRRSPAWQGPLLNPRRAAGVEVLGEDPGTIRLRVEAAEPTPVALRRWFFPGWSAVRGEEDLEVGPGPGGALTVVAPAGAGLIEVRYLGPAVRRWSGRLSLAALAVWVLLLLRALRGGSTYRAAR